MKRFLILLVCVAVMIVFTGANAQSITSSSFSAETPDHYYLQVKQFNEFIDRFNYISDWKGNLMGTDFKEKFPRIKYLEYLLNQEDVRFKNPNDSSYLKLSHQFLQEVTELEPQFISLFSGQVTAQSLVNIRYGGKNQHCIIQFLPEVLADRSAKWVISKVETDFFKTMQDSLQKYFLAPNSHETSFINLKRMESLSNPIYFCDSTVTTSNVLFFMTEVAAKRLTINNIEKITYEITFPNWLITVEEYSRSTNNSGWLISNVVKRGVN